ncbi:hypothetical protein QUF80_20210 [Desulfococcaceae bacterium HSG8]|nr:hypothetical protein [Desulfococcaceae bacterium HSG8]
MINFKQEELIEELVRTVREKFPETDLIEIRESSENPNTLWIRMTAPEDEEREADLREFSADKCTDILCDYGYHMLVLPALSGDARQKPEPAVL